MRLIPNMLQLNMADLFEKFNGTNLHLQDEELNSTQTVTVASTFVAKLLYKRNQLSQTYQHCKTR